MNHGSSSLDVVRAFRLSPRKDKESRKAHTSRGITPVTFKIFPDLAALEISEQELSVLAEAMHTARTPKTNPRIPAAYTYFGQFVSHDITAIPKKFSGKPWVIGDQTPCMDLDSVYGKFGENRNSFLTKSHLLKIGTNSLGEDDLPRDSSGSAIIADPRNDMSIMIAQIHLLFLNLHNAFIKHLKESSFKGDLFTEAKRLNSWHYQWIIVHDYLKRLLGEELLYSKISRPDAKKAKVNLSYLQNASFSYLPLEFSGAAYRMGHSMIRPSYYLNEIPNARNPRTGRAEARAFKIFDFEKREADLRGGRSLPAFHSLQWNRFLQFKDHPEPQYSQRIDTSMAGPMSKIPGDKDEAVSMARQNLLRGLSFELASGQTLAKKMGIKALKKLSSKQETPLWYYVLQEAEHHHDGTQLGPLGGQIIAEVFLAKLLADPESFLHQNPAWNPEQEGIIERESSHFELKDLLKFAEMPISREELEARIQF
ncbi:MAG: peroxidase family protein [Bacteroidia bacterium]|nr:peroxidase family protein [Bacteroidia bacterium]